ncbi:class I SAM-dependent methyltransferase [Laspinema olomoucense]|uniref:class I SAM-dependent methyltransferase n=1 Tax=Laspinema olomoucense TaxID=3231600 RepID=UPI0021BA8E00|nr:class I SAM-dependent methyltransferase [Laspinema sp. D3d]MCT7976059.1 class I SAM-dependent methyltransferase [Laspinema sp. D3d]
MTSTNDYKWLIPSSPNLGSKSLEEEKALWDKNHEDYTNTSFSITQDPKICKTLIRPEHCPGYDIPNSPDIKVLIPGCGSEIYLQKTLLEFCPQIGQVYCTDFSKTAIEKSQADWKKAEGDSRIHNQEIVFEEVDSTRITEQKPEWNEKFDYVLLANSVVSSEDKTNREMIREFGKVLKPGGKIYGYFPTTLCFLEIAYFSRKHAHCVTEGFIDVYGNKVWDAEWQEAQIYYTPLRLNRIFKEAGLKQLSLEMQFLDYEPFVSLFKEMIDHDDPDIFLWHLLVRYEK